MISLCTFGVAVAVKAITGISGFIWIIISLSLRYSGLKSCPHSEIQCASSTAKKDILRSLKNIKILLLGQGFRSHIQHFCFAGLQIIMYFPDLFFC